MAINMASDKGIAPPTDISLPMLQDTNEQGVWSLLSAVWRDVYVLDPSNQRKHVVNLTSFSLTDPTNYADLKRAILAVATPPDSNKNGLADDLETSLFGELLKEAPNRAQLLEIAFASRGFAPSFRARNLVSQVETSWTIPRRAFGGLGPRIAMEHSLDAKTWTSTSSELGLSLKPIYDPKQAGMENWSFQSKDDTTAFCRCAVTLGKPLQP